MGVQKGRTSMVRPTDARRIVSGSTLCSDRCSRNSTMHPLMRNLFNMDDTYHRGKQ